MINNIRFLENYKTNLHYKQYGQFVIQILQNKILN